MSTYLDDLSPEVRDAMRVVGNQSTHCLLNMVAALRLCPHLNTAEDDERLAAAKVILRARGRKPGRTAQREQHRQRA